jgi:DNA-binding transcriptional regulator LsrR (DeoR family)
MSYRSAMCRACRDEARRTFDLATLIQLYLAGRTQTEVGRALGVSRQRVQQLVKKYRLDEMLGVNVR